MTTPPKDRQATDLGDEDPAEEDRCDPDPHGSSARFRSLRGAPKSQVDVVEGPTGTGLQAPTQPPGVLARSWQLVPPASNSCQDRQET